MTQTGRIKSMDIIRGISLMFIIFFHSSIYNFANIHKIDFSNPPIFIVLMSFMALWGGIFIIYSMVVNTFMTVKRVENGLNTKPFIMLTYTFLILIVVHYILNLALGRWNIDFVNNQPHLTLIAATIRNGNFTLPSILKFYEGSSISTIAFNMLIVGWLLYLMLKVKMSRKAIYWVLGTAGTVIILLSFIRVHLFQYNANAVDSGNFILSVLYSFFLSNPYPLITYTAYGLFGALIGLMIFDRRRGLLAKIIIPIGLILFIYGVYGMMNYPKSISKPDMFWYFKTNFELGFFLFSITLIYLLLEGRDFITDKLSLIGKFSRISLTIYLLETAMSEIISKIITPLIPGWNQTINSTLLFGLCNVIIWIVVVYIWSKFGFKYSLEYFWVRLFRMMGKESTKGD